MKLHEAIRLGAMMKPQGAGRVERDGRTCALGAALDAIGVSFADGWFPVYDHWPIARLHVEYPGTNYEAEGTVMLGSACWLLNDADHWTREQIADFVETIERAQETPGVESAQEVTVVS